MKTITSCLLWVLLITSPIHAQSELEIVHINIGQGASTLILGPQTANGRVSVLFDAGQGMHGSSHIDGGQVIYDMLKRYGITELDYLVVSHYDTDHYGGVIYGTATAHQTSFLLGPDNAPGNSGDDDGDGAPDWEDSEFIGFDYDEWGLGDDIKASTLIDPGTDREPNNKIYPKYAAMRGMFDSYIAIDDEAAIDSVSIDLGGGATIVCLAGNGIVKGHGKVQYANTSNERSISFLVQYQDFDYLVSGDLIGRDSGGENARLEYYVGKYLQDSGIQLDVLQVNHHGANNASDAEFLRLTKPEVAVISVGPNPYGHPYPYNLSRLVYAGVQKIYQTNEGTPKWPISAAIAAHQVIANDHMVLTSDGVNYTLHGDTYSTDE